MNQTNHPVIQHLLSRKNKKVPVKDRRTISLIHFGGLMTGVRGAGAMIAFEELGLSYAFDNIYTISAGFANASYLLSHQTKLGTSIYYDDMKGDKFIKFYKLWKIADIDYVMDVVRFKKILNAFKIIAHKTKLFARVDNGENNTTQYLEVHKFTPQEYLSLFKAAISVPFLYPGYTEIGKYKFKDPDFRDKTLVKHVKHVLASKATDVVILYNQYSQYKYVNEKLKNLHEKRVLQIYPDEQWELSIFETRPAVLKYAAKLMGDKVKKLFGNKNYINLQYL